MKTRISNKSDFILLLLACMMSVAVLNTRSIDPDEAGTQKICMAISAKFGNLPAFLLQMKVAIAGPNCGWPNCFFLATELPPQVSYLYLFFI